MNDSRLITENGATKKKSLFENLLLTEIWQAMWVVLRHLWTKGVTFQYPHQKRPLPDGHRGALSLLRYDDGRERCVGCDLCEAACPSHCITVISQQVPDQPLVRYAKEFYIDMTKCVFCGFCVEACPVNALGMTKMYEYSTENKRDLMFDKRRLYEIGDAHFADAKAYLVAHGQETADEKYQQWRYKFPLPVSAMAVAAAPGPDAAATPAAGAAPAESTGG